LVINADTNLTLVREGLDTSEGHPTSLLCIAVDGQEFLDGSVTLDLLRAQPLDWSVGLLGGELA